MYGLFYYVSATNENASEHKTEWQVILLVQLAWSTNFTKSLELCTLVSPNIQEYHLLSLISPLRYMGTKVSQVPC